MASHHGASALSTVPPVLRLPLGPTDTPLQPQPSRGGPPHARARHLCPKPQVTLKEPTAPEWSAAARHRAPDRPSASTFWLWKRVQGPDSSRGSYSASGSLPCAWGRAGPSSGSHSAPGTCVFRDTRLRTQNRAGGFGPLRYEVRLTEPQRPVGQRHLPQRALDARLAITRDEVRASSPRRSSPGQGGGLVPRCGGWSSRGSRSPAWPPPGDRVTGKTGLFPGGWQPQARGQECRRRRSVGAGLAVRRCWAHGRGQGQGRAGRWLCLPNATLSPRLPPAVVGGPDGRSGSITGSSGMGTAIGSLNDLTVRFNSSTTFQ